MCTHSTKKINVQFDFKMALIRDSSTWAGTAWTSTSARRYLAHAHTGNTAANLLNRGFSQSLPTGFKKCLRVEETASCESSKGN